MLAITMPQLEPPGPSSKMTLSVSAGQLTLDTTANTVTWPITTTQSALLSPTNFYTLRRVVLGGEVRYYAKGRIFGEDGPVGPANVVVTGVGPQGIPGEPGPTGEPGPSAYDSYVALGGTLTEAEWSAPASGSGIPTYTAGAVISGDKPLMFSGAGTVVHADPTAPGYVYAGIALTAAQPGAAVQAQSTGDVTADFWAWTPGLPVFVAPAALTQTPPPSGRSHIIGWAVSAQTIHLTSDPVIPIL